MKHFVGEKIIVLKQLNNLTSLQNTKKIVIILLEHVNYIDIVWMTGFKCSV